MLIATSKDQVINAVDLAMAVKLSKPGAIVYIKGYENNYGDIADYWINGKVSYPEIVSQSLREMTEIDIQELEKAFPDQKKEFLVEQLAKAIQATEKNYSSMKENPRDSNIYITITDGLQLHPKTRKWYVWGLAMPSSDGSFRRVIKESGSVKPAPVKLKTQIKEWIQSKTALSRFRRFVLDTNFESISLVPNSN
jgi:hypothetical protein